MKGKILSTAVAVFRDERVKGTEHHACRGHKFSTDSQHGQSPAGSANIIMLTHHAAQWAGVGSVFICAAHTFPTHADMLKGTEHHACRGHMFCVNSHHCPSWEAMQTLIRSWLGLISPTAVVAWQPGPWVSSSPAGSLPPTLRCSHIGCLGTHNNVH